MSERTIIVDAIVRVVVALCIGVLIPAIKAFIDKNKDNKEMQLVMNLARIAVKSVADDLKTEEGAIKRDVALKRLVEQVNSWGIKDFTKDELDHYIATAYVEMTQAKPIAIEPLPVSDKPE